MHVRRQVGICKVMEYLPFHTFRRIVTRYAGELKVKSFSCLDQFLSMAFAQLMFLEISKHVCAPSAQSFYHHERITHFLSPGISIARSLDRPTFALAADPACLPARAVADTAGLCCGRSSIIVAIRCDPGSQPPTGRVWLQTYLGHKTQSDPNLASMQMS